jgi:hypothetical protein
MTERASKGQARTSRNPGGRATPARTKATGGRSRKPAAAAAAAQADGHDGVEAHKAKLLRDSFTIPENEYAVLAALKERATHLRRPAKKSELLRAGIAALQAMNDKAFLAVLGEVPSLKTGRPKVHGGRKGEDRG